MQKARKHLRKSKAFSLIELIAAVSSAAILVLAVAVFLGNGQRNWNHLFERVYGQTVTDSFVAHKIFDAICRKASTRKVVVEDNGQTLELYYWDAGSSEPTPENHARFYLSDDELYVRHGKMQPGTWQPDHENVGEPLLVTAGLESVKFTTQGTSVQMYLTYADETLMPVICSTVPHNQ